MALATLIEPSGDIVLAGSAVVDFSPRSIAMTLVRVKGSSAACTIDSDCEACERCDGSGFCVIGSRSGCTAATPGAAKLLIRNKSYRGKSKLGLKWAGSVPSFDPTASDDVGICLFHGGARILKAVAPAGGTCGTAPCWSGSAPVFAYADPEKTPDGVKKVKVSASTITATASGPQLDRTSQGVPSTFNLGPLGAPVVMQLQTGDSACVEATFDANRRISSSSFAGRGD